MKKNRQNKPHWSLYMFCIFVILNFCQVVLWGNDQDFEIHHLHLNFRDSIVIVYTAYGKTILKHVWSLKATCLWRRTLVACLDMTKILAPLLAKRLGTEMTVAVGLMNRLEKEGFLKSAGKGKRYANLFEIFSKLAPCSMVESALGSPHREVPAATC